MSDLEEFMSSLHCSQISFETLCKMYLEIKVKNKELKAENKLLRLGEIHYDTIVKLRNKLDKIEIILWSN